jgi:hypothetical protein
MVGFKKLIIGITLILASVIYNSCVIDRCEGNAFFERAIRIIFLNGEQDVRITEPIQISVNGEIVGIAEDGIVDLDEWQANQTNNPETLDLNDTYFLEYQLDFLEIINNDTTITQTDVINLEYTVNNDCLYFDIETMIVRHNGEIIFDGSEFGAFSHLIRN